MGSSASCPLIMWHSKKLEERAGTDNLFLRNLPEFMKVTLFYEGKLRLAVSKSREELTYKQYGIMFLGR